MSSILRGLSWGFFLFRPMELLDKTSVFLRFCCIFNTFLPIFNSFHNLLPTITKILIKQFFQRKIVFKNEGKYLLKIKLFNCFFYSFLNTKKGII
jgi:hypothetical protein